MIKQSLIGEFQGILGKENVLTSKEALRTYSYGGTTNWIREPDVVLFPTSAGQVASLVRIANREKIPLPLAGEART